MKNREIRYHLELITTKSQTGFFSVVPENDLTVEESLTLLRLRPYDDFLHKYALAEIGKLTSEQIDGLLREAKKEKDGVLMALILEHLLLANGQRHTEKQFLKKDIKALCRHSPLINIRSVFEPERELHSQWITLFRENFFNHTPLPSPDESGLRLMTYDKGHRQGEKPVSITEIRKSFLKPGHKDAQSFSPLETAEIAEKRLVKAGVDMGELMRHQSSLSPIALLRSWTFDTCIENNRNRFSFSGKQTSYGKGLTPDDARASLMMEIVERCSAFSSISKECVSDYQSPYPVRLASFTELQSEHATAVNPNDLALEVSYQDEPLHWICGETPDEHGRKNAWIPVQCIFLFCNLDEIDLFSGIGSTGFASGNTIEQAKVSALLEVIERHQESTMPVDKSTFFRFVSRNEKIASLLQAYRNAGVELQFQDITGPMGIPCCRCFVVDKAGEIQKGAAASLSAKRAIISAITETTCPFPDSPPSQPGPQDLICVDYEDLPDYSTGDPTSDLALLEALLIRNRYQPYYINLTRKDIGLPVVKAIIPGMEILGDFDGYSRVHPELFRNYLDLHKTI
ncbi:MAG: YcaO-like family protein [Proteobacteria bacterium]|nr:YcaO-like family protein [Pseudomonadota bacterium]